jgi:hypothetical protein
MSYYIHNVPGRLRIKIPSIKGDQDMAEEVQGVLRSIEGVNSAKANTLTGSIVIHYDPKAVRSKEILDTLNQAGYVDPSKAITNDQYIRITVSKVGQVIWKVLFGAVVEEALEGSALSLITVLI